MSSNVLYGIFLMRHTVLLAMLSYEISSFLGDMLANWACCFMGPGVLWVILSYRGMSSHGACHLMGHVVSWGMSSHGACCLMGHVVSWGMLSHGACRLMGHVVSWGISSCGMSSLGMSSHRACRLME